MYSLQSLTSLRSQSQQSLFPTPPQSELAVTCQDITPDVTPQRQLHGAAVTSMNKPLLDIVRQSILCSGCNNTFNRAVICHDYLIQLNRPIQCACGCVLCTLCYRGQGGCHFHKVSSKRGLVNATVNTLASCPDLESLGVWDLELDIHDRFKTYEEANGHVLKMLCEAQAPDLVQLRTAFEHLLTAKDSMSFKYWVNEAMPDDLAYRYVCIPHVPGFWDHVLVGTCQPPNTEKMIGPDDHLPKLFNVFLGSYRFHWCCFVYKKQIILAMWYTCVSSRGQHTVVPVVDTSVRDITTTMAFRRMVFYLSRWFTAQYVSPTERQLNVVLDCKPSEGSTLVHIIALLASRSGMNTVNLQLSQQRPKNDMNYGFSLLNANTLFTCPADGNVVGTPINIVDEFNYYHNNSGDNGIGLTRICTTTEHYSFI
ncbi:uncharacterized protein LOC123492750 [Coregonus clupeaformis]|uniref:uncharacterized protein LOC123492750 n=1 Tax=Coregonus clupeaformis TaxID=59861 RepID=UPI001E1C9986|nr:uncharacterized protein LOC123492750 [Coregonus clupeaformis]